MQSKYSTQIKLNKVEIIKTLESSSEFFKEESPSYGGQLYTKASMNRIFISEIEQDRFVISESCGLGGLFDVNGECQLEKLSDNMTLLSVYFRYGNFNVNVPRYLAFLLLLLGAFLLSVGIPWGVLFIGVSILPFVVMLTKSAKIRQVLDKFITVLEIKDDWK